MSNSQWYNDPTNAPHLEFGFYFTEAEAQEHFAKQCEVIACQIFEKRDEVQQKLRKLEKFVNKTLNSEEEKEEKR